MTFPPATVQSGFSRVAEALSDPAREAIVSALANGKAMPAGELAWLAGISPQSASAHLQKLVEAQRALGVAAGQVQVLPDRNDDVAALIEGLVDLAAKMETRRGKRALPGEELRRMRSCYCHLAGRLGVLLGDALIRRSLVVVSGRTGLVTENGLAWCRSESIDFNPSRSPRVPPLQRLDRAGSPFLRSVPQRHSKAAFRNRCVEPRDIPRALRLTRMGRAFFDRLGVKVPF